MIFLYSQIVNHSEPTAITLDLSEYTDVLDALQEDQNNSSHNSEYVEVSDLKQYVSGKLRSTEALYLSIKSLPDKFDKLNTVSIFLQRLNEDDITVRLHITVRNIPYQYEFQSLQHTGI